MVEAVIVLLAIATVAGPVLVAWQVRKLVEAQLQHMKDVGVVGGEPRDLFLQRAQWELAERKKNMEARREAVRKQTANLTPDKVVG